jgi:hypothetical protein
MVTAIRQKPKLKPVLITTIDLISREPEDMEGHPVYDEISVTFLSRERLPKAIVSILQQHKDYNFVNYSCVPYTPAINVFAYTGSEF